MADPVVIRVVEDIGEVAPADWDRCANPLRALPPSAESPPQGLAPSAESLAQHHHPAPEDAAREAHPPVAEETFNPFISHAFLSALERSGAATGRTGWQPQHLLLDGATGLRAAAPCYRKSHSRGEYVFDHGWAEAYERAGGRYYPKLQVAVPFTPVTGRRLLLADDDDEAARAALREGLLDLCRRRGASSVHVTFATTGEARYLGAHGFLQRIDHQFHWANPGYGSFGDFAGALSSRKRKTLLRERREALACGLTVEWLTGSDLTEAVWDDFFAFYMDTGSRKWGRPYLTRAFFSLIGESLRDRILLVMARRAGRYIAGAINFIGDVALYGRHWGAIEHHPFLHFELCYYQAMDFAIRRGLRRVEAGAQGEHKVARGYVPVTTHSAHAIADPALRRAIADYLVRERAYVDAAREVYEEGAPFRKHP